MVCHCQRKRFFASLVKEGLLSQSSHLADKKSSFDDDCVAFFNLLHFQ